MQARLHSRSIDDTHILRTPGAVTWIRLRAYLSLTTRWTRRDFLTMDAVPWQHDGCGGHFPRACHVLLMWHQVEAGL